MCVGMPSGVWLALVHIWLACSCGCAWPPVSTIVGIGIFVSGVRGLFGMYLGSREVYLTLEMFLLHLT